MNAGSTAALVARILEPLARSLEEARRHLDLEAADDDMAPDDEAIESTDAPPPFASRSTPAPDTASGPADPAAPFSSFRPTRKAGAPATPSPGLAAHPQSASRAAAHPEAGQRSDLPGAVKLKSDPHHRAPVRDQLPTGRATVPAPAARLSAPLPIEPRAAAHQGAGLQSALPAAVGLEPDPHPRAPDRDHQPTGASGIPTLRLAPRPWVGLQSDTTAAPLGAQPPRQWRLRRAAPPAARPESKAQPQPESALGPQPAFPLESPAQSVPQSRIPPAARPADADEGPTAARRGAPSLLPRNPALSRVMQAMEPVLDKAWQLTDGAFAAARDEPPRSLADASADDPAPAGTPRVANHFHVNVALGGAGASAGGDPQQLQDALVALLRDAARRQGLDV